MPNIDKYRSLTIVMITNNYKPYSGGVVSSIDAFASGLRQLGHTVIIVTLDFCREFYEEVGVVRIYCPMRFKYKKNPMAIPWRARYQLEKIFEDIKPDIVHSQHPFLLGAYAAKICRNRCIPLVFTHHTHYAQYAHYIPLPQSMVRPVINSCVERYIAQVQMVIAPSSMVKQELELRGVTTPIRVLPSPLLPMFFEQHYEKTDFWGKEPIKLLTVSRFMPEKNIELLLDTVAHLPRNSYFFTLVGYGAQLSQLQKYAYERLGLSEESVRFVVRPSKEKLISLYRFSDLFIFASKTETQGLVVAEAMASGLPVIAVEAPALRDIVKDGVNGYLVADAHALAGSIQDVRVHPEKVKTLSAAAALTAQRYKQEQLSYELVDIYASILGKYSV